jgi:hypothetical protein
MDDPLYLYRYETSSMGYGEVELRQFEVLSETPKGYWIVEAFHYANGWIGDPSHTKKRWVSKDGFRRFAHVLKKDAMISFQYRKRSQIRILERQLEMAKSALKKANEISDIKVLTYEELNEVHIIELKKSDVFDSWKERQAFIKKEDMIL